MGKLLIYIMIGYGFAISNIVTRMIDESPTHVESPTVARVFAGILWPVFVTKTVSDKLSKD